MSNNSALLERLVKESYKKINALEAELAATRQKQNEPIAVIGLGCRFPGAEGPDAYWQLLMEGRNAITDVLPERWNTEQYAALASATVPRAAWCRGGFLDQVDQFDPAFFRISALEADSMDPQQRLLLEVTWEALEHAGLAPDRLVGSKTGVFIGIIAGQSQAPVEMRKSEQATYAGTGATSSIAAGRLSYVLGLQGPCFALDTACSSALMATHLAIGNLRSGECDLALAGGVNVLLPEVNILMANAGWLAGDGRCKSFDATADGHARGEGCGIVVLKRLRDAVADGDKIWAVIRGSAVNHDGRTSGLTVPNGLAQQALIQQALHNAGVQAAEVSYTEAHAIGTALGDAIEVGALGAVYADRTQPLLMGSVKPNLGHLEAASGASSLIKLVLALYHGELPPHIGMQIPNPDIPWSELPLAVVTARQPWPQNPVTDRRLAGVSGFGISGTNVHMVLEATSASHAAATAASPQNRKRPLHLLTLAAKDQPALQALARRYASHLAEHPELSVPDLCFTANTGRAHFSHRLAIVTGSEPGATLALREQVAAFAAGENVVGIVTGQTPTARPKIAFLFNGLGLQESGIGHQLYATQPVFRQAIDQCATILNVLYPDRETRGQEDKEKGQGELSLSPCLPVSLSDRCDAEPALFALEFALAELWKAWGVKPDVVLGHGLGEYVAACVAGVFSLEDALKLVVARSRLIEQASTDIPLAEPVLAQFERNAETLVYKTPHIKLISCVTNQPLARIDAAHWRHHLRQPPRVEQSIRQLQATDCTLLIEIGPPSGLLSLAQQYWTSATPVRWLPSLGSLQDDWEPLLQTLAELYVQGVNIDWRGFAHGQDGQKVVLPTYPFQRQRFGVPTAPTVHSAVGSNGLDGSLNGRIMQQGTPQLNGKSNNGLSYPSLQTGDPAARSRQIEHYLCQQIGAAVGRPAGEIAQMQTLDNLGLDSLLLMGIKRNLQADLGVNLPLANLIQGLSLAQLTTQILTELDKVPTRPASATSNVLIPLHPRGAKPPLFCIHPVAGTVSPYNRLGTLLGEDQPVYGLQAVGVDSQERPLTALPEMATRYLAAMRTVQPHGPYFLGGWSYGALVAFEMAHQLEQLGEPIGLLAMFDQAALATGKLALLWHGVRFELTTVLPHLWPYVVDSFQSSRGDNSAANRPLAGSGTAQALRNRAMLALGRVMLANAQALLNYQPQRYAGRITLFQTAHHVGQNGRDPTWGWGRLAQGGVARYAIPGHHMNLLRDPQVQTLAAKLQQVLHDQLT